MNAKRNPHQARHYNELDEMVWRSYREITAYLDGLSDAQLKQADRMVQNLSTTNCGWTMYAAQNTLKHAIHDQSMKRLKPAKKSA